MLKWHAAAIALCFSAISDAEVTDVTSTGFHVSQKLEIQAGQRRVWDALTLEIADWWNPELTVSGDASWLQLDLRPGGCLCELFDDSNGVEHFRITGVRAPYFLRLNGGLGPLGLMGVNGNMTIELMAKENNEESSTDVELIYAVGGYHPDGLDALAEQVDAVLADVLARLRRYIERADHD